MPFGNKTISRHIGKLSASLPTYIAFVKHGLIDWILLTSSEKYFCYIHDKNKITTINVVSKKVALGNLDFSQEKEGMWKRSEHFPLQTGQQRPLLIRIWS